jgi:hypothetical protein
MSVSKLNKNKILELIIKQDNNHQAHPIKELLEKAATINKSFTLKIESSEECCNWTNILIVFKNAQVVPFYLPKTRMLSISIENDTECEFTYNMKSALTKF